MLSISPADIAAFLEWRKRSRGSVVHLAEPPGTPASLRPAIERIEYAGRVRVGEPARILVVAFNRGRQAWIGGITVSFPTVISDGDLAYVTAIVARVSGKHVTPDVYARNAGERIWVDGEPIAAKHMVQEVSVRDWRRNQKVEFGLQVLPLGPGILPFLVRAWTCEVDWAECGHMPAAATTRDQQAFGAYPLAISVAEEK
jgi:hypothetical protein